MSCKIVVSLLLCCLAVATAQSGWCNVQSCKTYKKGTHTMCAHPKPGPAKACLAKDDQGGYLSKKEKQSIVDVHNQLRQQVASGNEKRGSNGPQPGGHIPNVEWDDTLAAIAQRWADQCDYNHDSCRDVPDYQVGQNIGYRGTTGPTSSLDMMDIVKSWYNEVQYFNRDEVPNFSGNLKAANGKDIGHYTQLVWGETTKIGCGRRFYFINGMNRVYLVCNYGPSGNFKHHAVYETS